MLRWPLILLLLAPLAGCVADNGPDVDAYDGPYYYDGGTYAGKAYDFDYAYQQRAVYSRTYYYPPPYYGGYFYGGSRSYRRGDRDDAPRRNRDTAARGEDGRDRVRDDDRSRPADRTRATPPRGGGESSDRGRTRASPNRPNESNLRSADRPSRPPSGSGAARGGYSGLAGVAASGS